MTHNEVVVVLQNNEVVVSSPGPQGPPGPQGEPGEGGGGGGDDATTTAKGILKLAGDLSGTADLPTVPGLADKEATVAGGTSGQYYRGDKTWQTLGKTAVGLANADNTSDAAKPVSTATQTALDGKASVTHASTHASAGADPVTVAESQVTGLVADLAARQPLDSDLTAIAALAPTDDDVVQRKAGAWTNRTPGQLKADLTLTKSDVGLGNVDNTSDANKPVSAATQTALDGKALWPSRFDILYTSSPAGGNWTYQPIKDANAFMNGYQFSPAGASVHELTYTVGMSAGTWNFHTSHLAGSNLGQYTVVIDGVESAIVDSYAGGYAPTAAAVLTGTVIATPGYKTITIRKKGTKNASSTDYYILWTSLSGSLI